MTDLDTATPTTPRPAGREQWLTRGTAGIGTASQSVGNLVASVTAGILWTAISPAAAFLFAAGAMLLALAAFAPGVLALRARREHRRVIRLASSWIGR
jgi:thiazole synthase ThiGH ThiG subunit